MISFKKFKKIINIILDKEKTSQLNSLEITEVIKFFRIKEFQGFIFSSKIYDLKNNYGFYLLLIENDDNNEISHWIAIYHSNYFNYYYDPLGKPPKIKYFEKYKWNDDKTQYDGTITCGYYCLYFIYSLSK